VAAIAEAIGFAQRNHIQPDKLAEALSGGWADSKPLQVFVPRMLQAQATSIGALSTMLKDVDTILQTAQDTDAPMPVTACVQQLLRMAKAMGLGEAELSALISVVQPERLTEFLNPVAPS
jgi:2-hydroxy-3-oxopropionate reductase